MPPTKHRHPAPPDFPARPESAIIAAVTGRRVRRIVRTGNVSIRHPWARSSAPLIAFILAALILGQALAAPSRAAAQDAPEIVATVNGAPITRAEFHARVRFVRWQYLRELNKLHELTAGNLGLVAARALLLAESLREGGTLGASVLAQMEDDLLAHQAAAQLALEPPTDDIAARRDAFFSLWTGVAPDDLASDAKAQAFIAEWYTAAQDASGLDRDTIDAIFATEALWDALYGTVAAQAPTEELNVRSRHILCRFGAESGGAESTDPLAPAPTPALIAPPTSEQRAAAQDCIRAAQARLAGGEPFSSVAADLSADAASAARGGDLGWAPLSYLVDGFAAAAETAPLNAVIGPVETEQGLHLIEVLGREVRPLSASVLAQAQADLFAQWLDTLRAGAAITRSSEWQVDIPATAGLDALAPDVRAAVERLENSD